TCGGVICATCCRCCSSAESGRVCRFRALRSSEPRRSAAEAGRPGPPLCRGFDYLIVLNFLGSITGLILILLNFIVSYRLPSNVVVNVRGKFSPLSSL